MDSKPPLRRAVAALVAALLVVACNAPTGDRWGLSHLYLRGQVTDTLGAAIPGATVSVEAFPKAVATGCASAGSPPLTTATASTDAAGHFGVDLRAMGLAGPFQGCLTIAVDPHTGLGTVGWTEARFVGGDLAPDTAVVNFVLNP